MAGRTWVLLETTVVQKLQRKDSQGCRKKWQKKWPKLQEKLHVNCMKSAKLSKMCQSCKKSSISSPCYIFDRFHALSGGTCRECRVARRAD